VSYVKDASNAILEAQWKKHLAKMFGPSRLSKNGKLTFIFLLAFCERTGIQRLTLEGKEDALPAKMKRR